jgi:hypothetical protein
VIYHTKYAHTLVKKESISVRNPKNMVNGIIPHTSMFATGASTLTCQKVKIITGSVGVIAASVRTKLSRIAKNCGRNLHIFLQKS